MPLHPAKMSAANSCLFEIQLPDRANILDAFLLIEGGGLFDLRWVQIRMQG